MLNKIIRFFYYILFFITPFLMSPFTSELFEFNKMIFIYFIATCVFFFNLLKMILAKKTIFKRTPFDIPILIFLISQILSLIFSIDPHTSLFGYYGRFNGGLISIISYIILYYGFVSNFKLEHIKKALKISLFSSFLVILWGLPGKIGYDTSCYVFTGKWTNNCWTDQFKPALRMFSTLGQPNWLGAYLAINFFIAFYFLFSNILKDNKKAALSNGIYIAYLILNFSSILFTRSRSAIFSVIIGIIFFFIYILIQKRDKAKEYARIIIAVFLTGLFLIILFKTGINKIDKYINWQVFVVEKQSQLKDKNKPQEKLNITDSFDIRKIVWKGAAELGNKYSLFGTGVETFAYSYYFVRPQEHNLTSEWDYLYNKAHNEYLNYFATCGYIGLFSYLAMIFAVLLFTISKIKKKDLLEKDNKFLAFSLLISYLTILITNFFGFSTSIINIFFYIIPAIIFISLTVNTSEETQESQEKAKTNTSNLKVLQYIYLVPAVLFLFFSLSFIVRYVLADIQYSQAEIYAENDDYQNSILYLSNALDLKYEHVYQDKLSYDLANLAFITSYSKDEQVLTKKLKELSILANNESLKASPKNVLYWKTKAKDYYLFYQINLDKHEIEKGIEALKIAKKLSPTDPKISYSLSLFYSLLYDDEKQKEKKLKYKDYSLVEIERVIKLKSNYYDGYFLKAQLYEKYGENDKAKSIYEYILKNFNPDDKEVLNQLEKLN